VCDNVATGDCEINLNSFSTHIQTENFETSDDLSYIFDYDEDTRIVSVVFSILSGDVATMIMNVSLYDQLGNTTICTDTLTSSSGTLSCTIPTTFGNATAYMKLTKDGTKVGGGFINLFQEPEDIYGSSLVFLGLILILTLVGAGIQDNPVITAIFLGLGAIIMIGLNIIDSSGFIGAGATILWLFIAIILVIIKGSKRQ